MRITKRLRQLRIEKDLTQEDIEKRTGLLRSYISRVEHGHTVPSVETLEKLACALEVPMYRLFYDGEEPPRLPDFFTGKWQPDLNTWGSTGEDSQYLRKLLRQLGKTNLRGRQLIMHMAQKTARR